MMRAFKAVRLDAESYPVEPEERSQLEAAGAEWTAIEKYAVDGILATATDCDALLVVSSKLPAELIGQLARCRVIARLGAGTDRIAVDMATTHGILVANVPDFCINEMADHAMALLLAWARRLFYMAEQMRLGNWNARHNPAVHRLAGQSLGLAGFGASAQAVAVRAKPFGLRLQAWARNPDKYREKASRLGVDLIDFESLLATSDFLSVHIPLTPETRGLIGAGELERMKSTVILINTSRGAIIDEDALVAALRARRIGGAALDTFAGIDVFDSTGPPVHPLLALENVILTPHCSGSSVESTRESKVRGAANAAAVLRGHWPPYVVNSDVVPRFPLAAP